MVATTLGCTQIFFQLRLDVFKIKIAEKHNSTEDLKFQSSAKNIFISFHEIFPSPFSNLKYFADIVDLE